MIKKFLLVYRDPEQPGEADQAAAAHPPSHLPPQERGRDHQEVDR